MNIVLASSVIVVAVASVALYAILFVRAVSSFVESVRLILGRLFALRCSIARPCITFGAAAASAMLATSTMTVHGVRLSLL
jgi:hypothetical protein